MNTFETNFRVIENISIARGAVVGSGVSRATTANKGEDSVPGSFRFQNCPSATSPSDSGAANSQSRRDRSDLEKGLDPAPYPLQTGTQAV